MNNPDLDRLIEIFTKRLTEDEYQSIEKVEKFLNPIIIANANTFEEIYNLDKKMGAFAIASCVGLVLIKTNVKDITPMLAKIITPALTLHNPNFDVALNNLDRLYARCRSQLILLDKELNNVA